MEGTTLPPTPGSRGGTDPVGLSSYTINSPRLWSSIQGYAQHDNLSMAYDVELQQEVFNKTLEEVAHENEHGSPGPCVICLETITEPSVAVPCNHTNFDFLCLVSWLQRRRSCPLCSLRKTQISAVKYDLHSLDGAKLYTLPSEPTDVTKIGRASPAPNQLSETSSFHDVRRPYRRRLHRRPSTPNATDSVHDSLIWRRHIYRHQLFSLRVGSNRLSQYRELTPQLFNRDEDLVSRARKWIRRELQVFEFLNPDPPENSDRNDLVTGSTRMEGTTQTQRRRGEERLARRRANNAEFLLEYIVAILRTVDTKGSAGQAEELLREFIGRTNARLFLHELQSWLRSPYTNLCDWDRHVQYDDTSGNASTSPSRETSVRLVDRRDSTIRWQGSSPRSRTCRSGGVRKPYRPRQQYDGRSSREAEARARRIQHARNRYHPD